LSGYLWGTDALPKWARGLKESVCCVTVDRDNYPVQVPVRDFRNVEGEKNTSVEIGKNLGRGKLCGG
jgi:hypothetical protein